MNPYQEFQALLSQVLGPALGAAAYALEPNPAHQARGLLRYTKALGDRGYGFIEFQALPHADISRFRISLLLNSGPQARAKTPAFQEWTLSALIWNHYEARVLPAADYWWDYRGPQLLAQELYRAGQLLFVYGVPWLEGTDQDEPIEEA
jgi:hypothetical protein